MKKIIQLLVLLFSSSVIANEFPVTGIAQPGFCYPQLGSKHYTRGDFNSPFPRSFEIQCKYYCFNGESFDAVIAHETRSFISYMDEGKNLVCSGAVMSQVTEWGSTFWKVTGREFFLAFLSDSKELRSWANEHNIRYSLIFETSEHFNALKDLDKTVESYFLAGRGASEVSKSFLNAAIALNAFRANTLESNLKLMTLIDKIKEIDNISEVSDFTERLIYQVVDLQFKHLF